MTYINIIRLVVFSLLTVVITQVTADELNCVLCHKYKGLSRVDDKGNFKLYYILMSVTFTDHCIVIELNYNIVLFYLTVLDGYLVPLLFLYS